MNINELAHQIAALTARIDRDTKALADAREKYNQALVAAETRRQVEEELGGKEDAQSQE